MRVVSQRDLLRSYKLKVLLKLKMTTRIVNECSMRSYEWNGEWMNALMNDIRAWIGWAASTKSGILLRQITR